MKGALPRRLLETLVLALVFTVAYRFPAPSGRGYLEAAASLLSPILLCAALARGLRPGWAFLALFLGFLGFFHWMPHTIEVKGGVPHAVALLSGALLFGWEALGLLAVALGARWCLRRGGPAAAGTAAALGILLWEGYAFHVYPWSLGAALGGLPWLARGAAFVGAQGLAALLWGCGAWTGATLIVNPRRALAGPAAALALLLAAAGLWHLLPRGPERTLDVVMIQPNFEAGVRRPGMEQELWARSDAELRRLALPQPGVATLLLWPESSVLGRDDRGPNPRLAQEAQRRGIAWLFGTEGGAYNLVRGEVAGGPPFVQAKVSPMAFGERMPGPQPLRQWLDRQLGFQSQEPGQLTAASTFVLPTPQGPLGVHPLICSEALIPGRVREGLNLAGGELLSNHTNDGWFEQGPATDLHAAQIRMRAVETGLPLLRATLTGKSGVFREDGSWALWGAPMTAADYALRLQWRPVATPARNPNVLRALTSILAGILFGLMLRARRRAPAPAAPAR